MIFDIKRMVKYWRFINLQTLNYFQLRLRLRLLDYIYGLRLRLVDFINPKGSWGIEV